LNVETVTITTTGYGFSMLMAIISVTRSHLVADFSFAQVHVAAHRKDPAGAILKLQRGRAILLINRRDLGADLRRFSRQCARLGALGASATTAFAASPADLPGSAICTTSSSVALTLS
jgi:hypothetical protein